MLPEPIKKLAEAIDKAGMKIAFGLKQQGHIPTIKKMLKEGKSWEEIGEKIGWVPSAAEKWYKEENNVKQK